MMKKQQKEKAIFTSSSKSLHIFLETCTPPASLLALLLRVVGTRTAGAAAVGLVADEAGGEHLRQQLHLHHQRKVVGGNVLLGAADHAILQEPLVVDRAEHAQHRQRAAAAEDVVDDALEIVARGGEDKRLV